MAQTVTGVTVHMYNYYPRSSASVDSVLYCSRLKGLSMRVEHDVVPLECHLGVSVPCVCSVSTTVYGLMHTKCVCMCVCVQPLLYCTHSYCMHSRWRVSYAEAQTGDCGTAKGSKSP